MEEKRSIASYRSAAVARSGGGGYGGHAGALSSIQRPLLDYGDDHGNGGTRSGSGAAPRKATLHPTENNTYLKVEGQNYRVQRSGNTSSSVNNNNNSSGGGSAAHTHSGSSNNSVKGKGSVNRMRRCSDAQTQSAESSFAIAPMPLSQTLVPSSSTALSATSVSSSASSSRNHPHPYHLPFPPSSCAVVNHSADPWSGHDGSRTGATSATNNFSSSQPQHQYQQQQQQPNFQGGAQHEVGAFSCVQVGVPSRGPSPVLLAPSPQPPSHHVLAPSPVYAYVSYDPTYCQPIGQAADGYQYEIVRRPSMGADLNVPALNHVLRRPSTGEPYPSPTPMQQTHRSSSHSPLPPSLYANHSPQAYSLAQMSHQASFDSCGGQPSTSPLYIQNLTAPQPPMSMVQPLSPRHLPPQPLPAHQGFHHDPHQSLWRSGSVTSNPQSQNWTLSAATATNPEMPKLIHETSI